MSTFKTMIFTLFIATLLASSNADANAEKKPLFPAILIFGDSTADTGNNNYYPPTIFKANHLPYGIDLPGHKANGRFSNGKLISDVLATKLNIKELVPPFLQPNISDQDIVTGVCFASAGSGYDDYTSLSSRAIPVSKQPIMFKKYIARLKSIVGDKKAMEIINNAFVLISAGPNDFILNYYNIPTRRKEYPNIQDYQNFVLQRVDGFVRELYSLGCRNMMVGGVPPIGCLPVQADSKTRNPLNKDCLEDENEDSVLYNQKLQNQLPKMEASLPGSKFLYADCYDSLMDMIQTPNKYGFKETKKGCCGTGNTCNNLSETCSNHSDHLFWDSIHATEAAYNIVGNGLYEKIQKLFKA